MNHASDIAWNKNDKTDSYCRLCEETAKYGLL